jgi:hypothetical protein
MFVRAEAFNDLGGFDPVFFLYCEEEDLAIRMKKSGFSCYLVPEAKYIHFGGKSTGTDKGDYFKYLNEFYISQHYLYLKHFGLFAALIWRVTQFFRSLRKFYKDKRYIALAFIILTGPSTKNSIRYAEKIKS